MAVTAAQIAAVLEGRAGAIAYRPRYIQRGHDYAYVGEITPAVVACTLRLDNDQPILRTAQFTMDPNQATIDEDADHISVELDLLVEGEWTTFPMGVFHLNVPTKELSDANEQWDVDAADLTIHLQEDGPGVPWSIAASANFITGLHAITDILDSLGLTHAMPTTAETLATDMSWGPKVKWLQIVNELLFAINHYPIWSDAQGVFTSRVRTDPFIDTAAIDYNSTKMLLAPFDFRKDETRFMNRAVVVIDDPLRAPSFALRENADSDSPVSTVSSGNTILEEFDGSLCPDTDAAAEIAVYELLEEATRAQLGALRTQPDPRRAAHEVYQLTIPDPNNPATPFTDGTQWNGSSVSALTLVSI